MSDSDDDKPLNAMQKVASEHRAGTGDETKRAAQAHQQQRHRAGHPRIGV